MPFCEPKNTPRDPVRWLILLLVAVGALALSFQPQGEITSNRYLPFYHMQAQSFLGGHVHLDFPEGRWAQDAIPFEGRNYLAIGPLNAVLLLPFVAIWGEGFSERIFCFLFFIVFLGIIHRFLCVHVRDLTRVQYSLWLLFFAFGTDFLTCQVIGTAWFSAAMTGGVLVAAASLLALEARRLRMQMLSVAFCALAGLSRYHLGLLAPVFAFLLWSRGPRSPRRALALLAPVLGFCALIAAWNFERFGNVLALNYSQHNYAPYFAGAVQKYGLTSPRYIALHIYHGLFGMPKPSPEFPFFVFDDNGNGLFALSPLFLLLLGKFARNDAPKAERPLERAALLCALVVILPAFVHFSTGWRQFGYRYSLDFLPFLAFLLTRAGFRIDRPLPVLLVGVSIWFHVWGVLQFVQ